MIREKKEVTLLPTPAAVSSWLVLTMVISENTYGTVNVAVGEVSVPREGVPVAVATLTTCPADTSADVTV